MEWNRVHSAQTHASGNDDMTQYTHTINHTMVKYLSMTATATTFIDIRNNKWSRFRCMALASNKDRHFRSTLLNNIYNYSYALNQMQHSHSFHIVFRYECKWKLAHTHTHTIN